MQRPTGAAADAAGAAWDAVAGVAGWLTEAQADRLFHLAAALEPPAQIVEIGSFRGRSAIVLARAAAPGVDITAIDPHLGTDRGPKERTTSAATGASDNEVFWDNLRRAGVADRVRLVRKMSADALADAADRIDLLYIDGAHRYRPARADIAAYGRRVAPGGAMAIHDAFSSVGVTVAQLRLLVLSRRWRYEGRAGSLAVYRAEPLHGRAWARNVARHLAPLGWFARNLAIKAAVAAGWPRLAHHLGLPPDQAWPY